MRAVRAGKVEMLLASGLTRLGKSLHELANTVREAWGYCLGPSLVRVPLPLTS